MLRGTNLAIAGGAMAALLVGCGSSNSSSSNSSTSSSSSTTPASSTSTSATGGATVDSAFATAAGQVCTAAVQQVAAITQPGDPTKATAADLPAWATYFDKVVPIVGQALQQIGALPPPTQGVAGLQAAAAKAQAAFADLQHIQAAAHAANLTEFDTALLTYQQDNVASEQAFDALGIPGCGASTSSATSTSTGTGTGTGTGTDTGSGTTTTTTTDTGTTTSST